MTDNIINEEKGKWYVIQAMSGHENKVKDNLERQLQLEKNDLPIYEILIPVEKISEVKQGEKITSSRKFFPGYVLIRMDLYSDDGDIREDIWYFVRETQGVIGFIGCGADKRPLPLNPSEVKSLMNQVKEKEEVVAPKIKYNTGETVTVKEGAFENFEGVIDEIDTERGKLKVMVSIFGRSTPVELEFWQVEKND
ncbi:MAG: transcription termination/antitermination protein NusG [Victivallales bacterium]|nr:transcription termination/antitermination protein NusG [Victivallales bacterium]MCF7889210.1 transcription termination/antitermination protein NusG [Victivallales bacterium]